jgi:hypothetical protein
LLRASTKGSVMRLPKMDARLIALPDFVTLFDSLEDGAELQKFWTYLDETLEITRGLAGLTDHFAAFRDSHALLVPGAVTPDLIHIDPHWNSGRRFRELKEFWSKAPGQFPDGQCTWVVDDTDSGLTRVVAKGPYRMAWSGTVGGCVVQATMDVDDGDRDLDNGPLLELFVHCMVDALTQRASLLEGLAPCNW